MSLSMRNRDITDASVQSAIRAAEQLYRTGKLKAALKAAEDVCQKFPHNMGAWRLRGVIHLERKEFEASSTAFETAARNAMRVALFQDPTLSNSASLSGLSVPSGYSGPAMDTIIFCAQCFRRAARAQGSIKVWREALRLCDLGIEIKQDSANLHFWRGVILTQLESWSDSVGALQECVALDRQHALGWSTLCGALLIRGVEESSPAGMRAAREAAQVALKLNALDAVARVTMCMAGLMIVYYSVFGTRDKLL